MKSLFWIKRQCGKAVCFCGRIWMRAFGCTVASSAYIYGFPWLLFNRGTIIVHERARLNCLQINYHNAFRNKHTVLTTSRGGIIEIGEDCSLNNVCINAQRRVEFGKRVSVGPGSLIIDSNFHPVDAIPRRDIDDSDPQPVIIEDDVWISTDVMICKGVRIGHGSVIGAKSVVTRDIPPMVLAAGVPAQVIRPLNISEAGSFSALPQ